VGMAGMGWSGSGRGRHAWLMHHPWHAVVPFVIHASGHLSQARSRHAQDRGEPDQGGPEVESDHGGKGRLSKR